MIKFRPSTANTIPGDLFAFAYEIAEGKWDTEARAEIATWLNKKLDELLAMDAFGTEGQCDPRGDHRD